MWRDSSVGRAKDWKSLCPRFDPGSGHHFFCPIRAKKTRSRQDFTSLCCQAQLHSKSINFFFTSSLNYRSVLLVKSLHFIRCEVVPLTLHLWSCSLSGVMIVFLFQNKKCEWSDEQSESIHKKITKPQDFTSPSRQAQLRSKSITFSSHLHLYIQSLVC